ncbi:hypothetical protein [Streptomyces morookaense]|uniref:Uncharacterized protein n=1 Tax=Streptomyces morookaense TaxID=1970 RepID=A0A7Y7E815_STRMO|nr:hypothetical protein [Streptomyces morookaense]NVK78976.1 hypothetical protein [Streptomyces morookaense]GHF36487.1 hypothetical protein GCM10010359_44180 [Streptomyces morookaense]
MNDPRQRLQDALDALDTAFAPLSRTTFPEGGCTYCHTESDLEVLAGPTHLVPEQLVFSVACTTPDHWDDFPALYRRLTPRIVRLLIDDQLDHGMFASRLLAAGWRDWPLAERSALEEVWHAWWRSALGTYPCTGRITDILEALAATTGTLTPWLTTWAELPTEASDLHLSDALDEWLMRDELADLRLGFYGELHATPELLPWLLSLGDERIGAAQLMEVERIAYQ